MSGGTCVCKFFVVDIGHDSSNSMPLIRVNTNTNEKSQGHTRRTKKGRQEGNIKVSAACWHLHMSGHCWVLKSLPLPDRSVRRRPAPEKVE